MLELPDRGMNTTCKKRQVRRSNLIKISKNILDSKIKNIEGQSHNVEKIIKGLEDKFFVFIEDAERKKIFLYFLQQMPLRRSLMK